jgi:hypothetical protein
MKRLVLTVFVLIAGFFFSAYCKENVLLSLREAERGFQDRWQEFETNKSLEFPLWKADWTEEELKKRFDQFTKKRLEIYFFNPEDDRSARRYRPAFATPPSFPPVGSRYAFPLSFQYNLASKEYNASIISLHGKQFLALEAPSRENLSKFLYVLKEYQITDLVRLTRASDLRRENSFPYWEEQMECDAKKGTWRIYLQERKLNYFFTDSWNDQEGFEPEKLAVLVKSLLQSGDSSQRIAVHCRGGVGRTGTFLAALTLICQIDEQFTKGSDSAHLQISVDRVLWELALQRPFMITHFSQYQTLYRLINWYVDLLEGQRGSNSFCSQNP